VGTVKTQKKSKASTLEGMYENLWWALLLCLLEAAAESGRGGLEGRQKTWVENDQIAGQEARALRWG